MNRRLYITMSMLCAMFGSGASAHARSQTPTPSPKTSGRLIVQRAPNFGTDLSIRLLVDGKRVANIPRNQHYGGVLAAGRHTVTALALPNTQSRRPVSIVVTIKPGKVYIFTAMWDGDRLVLRPSDYYSPTTRANR